MKYEVMNYFDVWGNAKEGWEVNDQFYEGTMEFPEHPTDKEICDVLKNNGLLNSSDMRRLKIENLGPGSVEVYQKKGMKPLFGLMPTWS